MRKFSIPNPNCSDLHSILQGGYCLFLTVCARDMTWGGGWRNIYFLKALGVASFIFIILIKIIYSFWLCWVLAVACGF